MALVKCKKCNSDVSTSASYCIHCGTEIEKNYIGGALEEKNIITLLKFASTVRINLIILAVIVLIYGIVEVDVFSIVAAIGLYSLSRIEPAFIENKALMLKNIHEINRKVK